MRQKSKTDIQVKKINDSSPPSNSKRLRDILKILRKNKIIKGISPVKLRNIIEDLGPTFIKLGQIMSTRPDIIPLEYCDELSKLRAQVAPIPYDEVCEIVENELKQDLNDLFSYFERAPLGAASIAQAHKAKLIDGRDVVVKVQKPNIKSIMDQDVSLLKKASKMLNLSSITGNVIDFEMVLDEIYYIAQQEMDFLTEAEHLHQFKKLNKDIIYVSCPYVVTKLTTRTVLVMEHIGGIHVDDLETLSKQGYDRKEIAEKLAENYVKQILEDAFFHADPHSGNILIRQGQIVWIDLGMMGRLSKRDTEALSKSMVAVVEGDTAVLKEMLLTIGEHSGRINHPRLYSDIDDLLTKYASMSVKDMNITLIMEELMGLASDNGISIPRGFTMLGRGILILQSLLSTLDPDISIIEIFSNHLSFRMLKDFDAKQFITQTSKSALVSGRKLIDIPSQLHDLLKMTSKGQTKVNLEFTSSNESLKNINNIVDKLIHALIAAALLISSGLLCTVDVLPKAFGVPIIGVLGYIVAFVVIIRLLWKISKEKKK